MSAPVSNIFLIAVLCVFGLLFLIVCAGLYGEYECLQIYRSKLPAPEACQNGNLVRSFLELAGIIVGVLAAIRFLGPGS